jgi:caffeoyl-CoA O-methyltransferase
MVDVQTDQVAQFLSVTAPESDAVLDEMDEYARANDFPYVGPEVGATLRLIARLVDARRIFEFGSGYGYSAYWFADALPPNGEIVLTEFDESNLDMAREFMSRGGYDEQARFEHGDALGAVERYEGPFDVVLLDHQNEQYSAGFEAVRSKIPAGGVVVADNVIAAGNVDFEDLLALLDGRDLDDTDASTGGIAEYLERVREDSEFETVVLPVGEGVSVSVKLS